MPPHISSVSPSDLATARDDTLVGGALSLLLVDGTERIRSVALEPGVAVTLGRGTEADVKVDHPSISRLHLRVVVGPARDAGGSGASVSVIDLDSANGTWLRGERLAPQAARALELGDHLELGGILVALRRGPAGPTAAPPAESVPALPSSSPRAPTIMRDPAMAALYRVVERVAPSELSILLLGETGVGKEVVADAIHRASSRASGPLLRLNCAALSEGLLESELFGHERGAFTGAADRKLGLLETASGGTVLLDEVGELPLTTQVKLLRVIEQRELTRVGGLDVVPVNVRFVSATNRDIEAEVECGRFRPDLFYRLNGLTLRIPPLRERRSEIEALARTFLSAAAARTGRRLGFSPEALRRLLDYRWPGNVRELKQVMERAALLSPTELVDEASLQLLVDEPSRGTRAVARPDADTVAGRRESTELAELLHALEVCAGNQSRAARLLSVSRGTLLARLDKYGVRRPRK